MANMIEQSLLCKVLDGIPLAYMDFSKAGNSTPLRERESEPQIPAF